jgi:serine/threonine protein phosphatase PrpC
LTAAVRPSRPVAAEGSHPGRERENNEDRVLCDPERGIYAVIDGVGGESGGEVAAQTALDILRARLSRRTTDLDRLVREAIAQANRQIFERAQVDPLLSGMSCVLTVAILDGDSGDRATVGHVGDSRLYRLRRGEIRKVTRDHSPVGAREDAGEISEDEAMHHPRRNEIFRDVGSAPHEPEEEGFIDTQEIPFGPDDALLFCSDGLSDMVPSARMREIVESNAGDPQTAVQRLIEAANEAGGKDNISVVLVEGERYAALASKAPAESKSAPIRQYGSASVRVPGWRRALPWVLLLAVLAAAAAFFFIPGFFPGLQERLLGGFIGEGGITGPGESPTPTLAAVLRVGPGETDFATIGEALADARKGQTVEVAPGEYRETIELPDGVSLVSLQPRAAILHPPAGSSGSTSPVLTARGVDGRISGFRIVAEKDIPMTVGLRLDGSRVQVSEMEIAGAAEAGIEITGPDRSSIETSFLHDNAGPGVIVSGGAATQIQKNLISKNGKGKKAPGVEIRDDARPLLIDNRFEGNAAAGIWLPTAERADEIYGWNRFEGTARAKAVQVAPKQAQPTPTPTATPRPTRTGQGR